MIGARLGFRDRVDYGAYCRKILALAPWLVRAEVAFYDRKHWA